MSPTRSRPSPAMIVAALALTFALAGTAVAAPDAALVDLSKKQVKKIAKKVANKQITKRAPGLSVAHAKTADNATNATSAANAAAVGGLAANQLNRATTQTATTNIDNFDAAAFTDVVSRSVTAPTAGIFVISGTMNVNRDLDNATPTLLNVRGAVNGTAATVEANVRATEAGTDDQSVSISGAVAVAAGNHTVSMQAREVGGAALAFISERAITVQFVPFGDAGTQGQLRSAGSGGGANR